MVNNIVTFLLVAAAVFMIVKMFNRLRRGQEADPTTRECPECLSTIPIKATRCAYCTTEVVPAT